MDADLLVVEGVFMMMSSLETGKRGPCMLSRTAVNGTARESSKTGPRNKRGLEREMEGERELARFELEGVIKS